MKTSSSLLLVITLSLGLLGVGPVWAADQETPAQEGETIRVLIPTSSARSLQARESTPSGWTAVEVPVIGDLDSTLARARDDFGPEAILERVYPLAAPQDEPLFDEQWALHNTGQTGGTPDADIDAPTAWSVARGAGAIVAVIDSGIDDTHPDLSGQIIAEYDTRDDDGDASPAGTTPEEAHATMVASLVAASANGIGMTGVAPDASLINIRACFAGECRSLDIADGIYRAVDAGADIINLSLGSAGEEDPPLESAIAYARSRNVLVVAAVGNSGQNIDQLGNGLVMIPAGLPFDNILAVAASDHRDRRPPFSNYGPSGVDVFAPGASVLSADPGDPSGFYPVSGTSFSSPIAAGVAALLLSSDPGISYHELKARLVAFVDRPSGLSGLSANGRLNAGRSLTTRFADTSGSVFVNAIDWLADVGITEGCNPPQNHFYCPTRSVTRGEMAVFFARAFALPPTSTNYFNDDNGTFYEASANRMAAAGITVGCGGGRYCGERNITREEMAAMLARVLSLPVSNQDFFVDDSNSIFEGAINRIRAAGITQGCNPPTNNRYCPTNFVTRGEMSAFIKRAVEYP